MLLLWSRFISLVIVVIVEPGPWLAVWKTMDAKFKLSTICHAADVAGFPAMCHQWTGNAFLWVAVFLLLVTGSQRPATGDRQHAAARWPRQDTGQHASTTYTTMHLHATTYPMPDHHSHSNRQTSIPYWQSPSKKYSYQHPILTVAQQKTKWKEQGMNRGMQAKNKCRIAIPFFVPNETIPKIFLIEILSFKIFMSVFLLNWGLKHG